MSKVLMQENEEAVLELTEVFLTDAINTALEIDVDTLKFLGISELRNLAHRLGVVEPLSKTQEEIIVAIHKIVERETGFFECSCSAD